MKKFQRISGVIILIAGIFLRFYHLLKFDFVHIPFRLGGLFFAFAGQIINNGFRIPVNIPFYSVGGIPFAYPPVGFYVEAILLKLFPGDRFVIVNILPPFVSALALIAVYLLLRELYAPAVLDASGTKKNKEGHILAGVFAYAFMPLAFTNQIEAAGLAESFGSLFLVVYFAAAANFRRVSNWKNAVWVGVALGLCIISNPGSAIGAAILSVMLGLEVVVKNKFRFQSISWIGLVALTGGLVSSPYVLTVAHNHGKAIFILPVLAQYVGGEKQGFWELLLIKLNNFMIVRDGASFLWNGIIFLGLLWLLFRGKYVFPVVFFALFSIPREGIWLAALPATFLFAHGGGDIFPLLMPSEPENRLASHRWLRTGILMIIGIWMALQSFVLIDAIITDRQVVITAEQIQLMESVSASIPQNAKVLVIGNDALREWAPVLLQREVINTKFGLEWQPTRLEQIFILNLKIASATSWDEIITAVQDTTGIHQVYVLSVDKRRLTELSRQSTVPFLVKLETPALQLGFLDRP